MSSKKRIPEMIKEYSKEGFNFVVYEDRRYGLCLGVPGNTTGYAGEALGVYYIKFRPIARIRNSGDAEKVRKALNELKSYELYDLPKHYIPLDLLEINDNCIKAIVAPERIISLQEELEETKKGIVVLHTATRSFTEPETHKKYFETWSELGDLLLSVDWIFVKYFSSRNAMAD